MQRENPPCPATLPTLMSIRFAYRYLIVALLFSIGICHSQTAPAPEAPEKKEESSKVRILCVKGLVEGDEELMLANKADGGKWKELGKFTLRSPMISDWMPVPDGLTYMIRKKGEQISPLCSFEMKKGLKKAIVVLLPDQKNNLYHVQVIDPDNLGFQKGKALVINYGNLQAVVKIGSSTKTVDPGQQIVEKIEADADGMFALMIGHVDAERKIVVCYDHKVSLNPDTRKFILLFPDADTGLRAMSLSEFGPFE